MTSFQELAESIRLIPREEYHPFPKWGEKCVLRKDFIPEAEKAAQEPVLVLPATRFMDFQRNGNRSRYEALSRKKREMMAALAFAEMQEGKGRFIDPLIDRIWAMCEESAWCYPAHLNQYPMPDCTSYELPHPDEYVYIDLFAGCAGALLSLILYMLREPLEKESPVLVRRVEMELEKRIFSPYLGTDKMWWMAMDTPVKPNNWTPWVSSNIITMALLAVSDEERRLTIVQKAMRSIQKFVDIYPEDGGCDEGPSYFAAAGACLLDACDILESARQDGGESLFTIEKLKPMSEYIMHMHIVDDMYVNFADAAPHIVPPAGVVLRAARAMGSRTLEHYALSLPEECSQCPYYHPFRYMLDLTSPQETHTDYMPSDKGWYFPGIQVCTARSRHLFFAAKGGHNAESHNHNDVGNYILYADGKPVIVDIGPTEYTKDTFAGGRWKIPCFISPYHNTLIPNGAQQPCDREWEARDVHHSDDGETAVFSLDMAGAYPKEAGLEKFIRTFTLDRAGETLSVAEICLGENITLPIVVAVEPEMTPGRIGLGDVILSYDPAQFEARVEEFPLHDEKQFAQWGRKTLWRLLLTRAGGGEWKYEYTLRRNPV